MSNIGIDTVKVEQLIICTKERRGDGKNIPVRIITEVFDFDGNLIAEKDSFSFSIESIIDFIQYRFPEKEKEVKEWVEDYFLTN